MVDTSAERGALSPEDCWDLLRANEFGRLAYVEDSQPAIVPVNYAVDGSQLVFRTARGAKLSRILTNAHVAFEIDHIDDDAEVGRSVVVQGRANVLPADEELRLEQVGLRPWLDADKPVTVAIRPDHVTGRRYTLHRPWRRMLRR